MPVLSAKFRLCLVRQSTSFAQPETKDAYFSLIHETDFCDKVLREFGMEPDNGLIVNGHVPVKVEAGESPLKRSGKAITIDGAFRKLTVTAETD